jgi:hypothetical protein
MFNRRQDRNLSRRVENLSDNELEDWALNYALSKRDWYRKSKARARHSFQAVELSALLLASIVTVLAALNVRAWLTASIAALVTFLSGLRQLGLWHENWPAFSEAWAQISALVSSYRVLPVEERSADRRQQLVQAVDEVVLAETRRWRQSRLNVLQNRK